MSVGWSGGVKGACWSRCSVLTNQQSLLESRTRRRLTPRLTHRHLEVIQEGVGAERYRLLFDALLKWLFSMKVVERVEQREEPWRAENFLVPLDLLLPWPATGLAGSTPGERKLGPTERRVPKTASGSSTRTRCERMSEVTSGLTLFMRRLYFPFSPRAPSEDGAAEADHQDHVSAVRKAWKRLSGAEGNFCRSVLLSELCAVLTSSLLGLELLGVPRNADVPLPLEKPAFLDKNISSCCALWSRRRCNGRIDENQLFYWGSKTNTGEICVDRYYCCCLLAHRRSNGPQQ